VLRPPADHHRDRVRPVHPAHQRDAAAAGPGPRRLHADGRIGLRPADSAAGGPAPRPPADGGAHGRALTEALRVFRPGAQLVLAKYGARPRTHPFHRWAPLRWIFGAAEPFLPSLWRQDLDALLDSCASAAGTRVACKERVSIFGGFYRVLRYRVED